MQIRRTVFGAVLFLITAISVQGQISLSVIRSEQKCNRKICKYVESFKTHEIEHFNQLEASVTDSFSTDSFSFHQDKFTVEAPLAALWKVSMESDPSVLWKGKILSLAFIYSKADEKLLFQPDLNSYNLDNEQIYFINLRLLKGLFNLPTALKVTKVDPEQKIIEFTYLKGGKSEGRQTIQFVALSEFITQIIHTTYFRSGSKFRDRRLYPHFHQKTINELHKNMGNKALELH